MSFALKGFTSPQVAISFHLLSHLHHKSFAEFTQIRGIQLCERGRAWERAQPHQKKAGGRKKRAFLFIFWRLFVSPAGPRPWRRFPFKSPAASAAVAAGWVSETPKRSHGRRFIRKWPSLRGERRLAARFVWMHLFSPSARVNKINKCAREGSRRSSSCVWENHILPSAYRTLARGPHATLVHMLRVRLCVNIYPLFLVARRQLDCPPACPLQAGFYNKIATLEGNQLEI
jgi:hypothetical protein